MGLEDKTCYYGTKRIQTPPFLPPYAWPPAVFSGLKVKMGNRRTGKHGDFLVRRCVSGHVQLGTAQDRLSWASVSSHLHEEARQARRMWRRECQTFNDVARTRPSPP